MSSDSSKSQVAVSVHGVGKCYHVYNHPLDRLKQALWRGRRTYYREFWALRGVSFELRRGETIGIVGRNGSGKSTLLQIIAGTLTPSEGQVEVNGRVAALLELGSGFNAEFTGRENVYMNGAILGFSRAEIDDRFDRIASFADIGDFLDQPVKTYSSGMVVRLAFAVQVQVEPDILIVDEALAVGDLLFQKRCFQRIRELRDRGCTILFVSHDLESIRTLTDRAMFLKSGCIAGEGSPGDVLLAYRGYLHEQERLSWEAPPAPLPAPEPGASAAPADLHLASGGTVDKKFGDGDAEILEVVTLDAAGAPCSLFYPGELLCIRMRVRFLRPVTHTNIGLRLRNREGIKIYSWGTLNQDISIWSGRASGETFWDRTFDAGQEVTVDFRCPVALGASLYEIQAAVTEERDRHYYDQRTMVWKDEAGFFEVKIRREDYFFGGVVDLGMSARVVPPAGNANDSIRASRETRNPNAQSVTRA